MSLKMNHDFSHCVNFDESCPKKCFRAKLSRDLQNSDEQLLVTYCDFLHTDECPKKKNK